MATLNRYTVLAAAIAFACSAWAQQPPPDQNQPDQYSAGQFHDASDQAAQNQVDPPSRVARVAYLSGDVSFAAAGENDWLQAQRNRPMVAGDKLYTNTGRAELQIGTSSIFLSDRSNMDFLTLNDQTAQMELTQGSISLDVRRLNSGETYEVDTPTLAFIADQVGRYRIDVDPNGRTTTVSVTRGSGDAVGEGGNRVRIDEGQRVVFNDSQLSDYQTSDLRGSDGFDSYVKERVVRYERAPARRYVSEEVVGYEDLDDNGSWEDAPDYGHVWYPSGVATDWAPYHDGTWDWVEPYGWTWVDNASWGFAPFHYGRWAYIGSRWGWVPGPVDVRPVYAPALVAFVGGGGFSVGISTGPIGWFALGPRDVYFPGYPCGRDYFSRVNVSNTVVNSSVVNNYYGAFSAGHVNYAQINYANRSNPRAITAVPATTFASGRPVAASAIAVNRNTFANARVMSRATVAPTAASLVANRGRATPPPATVRNRTVVAANRPAPAPAPFAQRQALLRKNPGQPLTTAQMRTVAGRAPTARGGATAAVSTRPNVRLASQAGAHAPVVSARANANARAVANAPGNRAAPQPPANARGASKAQLPSAGFARQGSASANQKVPVNARQQAQTRQTVNAQANTRATASGAAATNRVQGQLPSSRFAQQTHGNAANAQANARIQPERGKAQASARVEPRGNATARTGGAAAQPRIPSAATRTSERAQAQMNPRARTEIGTPRPNPSGQAQQRAQAQIHAQDQARLQAQNRAAEARASAQQRSQAQARMSAQRTQQAQSRERVQAQTRVQPQQVQRAQAQAQRAPVQQRAQAQAQRAPVQQRAQAQYREPPRPTSQPQSRPVQHAPQQRQEAKRKDEKRDQNGGGG